MAQFSGRERFLASILSRTPRLKGWIKRVYITLNYIIHRKGYRQIVLHLKNAIELIEPLTIGDETFFGYYDKSPENSAGWVIFNETALSTVHRPSPNQPLWIHILNRYTKEVVNVGDTFSYTWQQGARAQWVSDSRLLYNLFQDGAYKAALYDMNTNNVERIFPFPVQDSFGEDYYLSINYARIMYLRPDYGYRNLPLLSIAEMHSVDKDGIWQIDMRTGQEKLIVSLNELVALEPAVTFNGSLHKVNHVMISPDGKGFIFIHRWYVGLRRFDRLVYCDFKSLHILASEDIVSHMCWIDPQTVFGYLRKGGVNGFYFIDVLTGEFTPCKTLSDLGNGDGHPSAYGDWFVIDTYPDKSRLQHLYLYNRKTDKVTEIAQVFQGIKYRGESRCDLHPRFSPDGRRVYFDTVYAGLRRLAFIDVSSITQIS